MSIFAVWQFAPQVGDMHIDGAVKWRQAFAQHFLAQQFARHHLAQVLRQQVEKGEFGAGQIEYLAVKAGFLTTGIKLQAINIQRGGVGIHMLLLFIPVRAP